jgi:hypothetical protein
MTYVPGMDPAPKKSKHTPLTVDEEIRFQAAMAEAVVQTIATTGTFRVTANTLEMRQRFQALASACALQHPGLWKARTRSYGLSSRRSRAPEPYDHTSWRGGARRPHPPGGRHPHRRAIDPNTAPARARRFDLSCAVRPEPASSRGQCIDMGTSAGESSGVRRGSISAGMNARASRPTAHQ